MSLAAVSFWGSEGHSAFSPSFSPRVGKLWCVGPWLRQSGNIGKVVERTRLDLAWSGPSSHLLEEGQMERVHGIVLTV